MDNLNYGSDDGLSIPSNFDDLDFKAIEGFEVIPEEVMLPAPCQGIICVQGVKNNKLKDVIKKISDPETELVAKAERMFVEKFNADCNVPLGAMAEIITDSFLEFVAILGSTDSLNYITICKLVAVDKMDEDISYLVKQLQNEIK